MGDDGGAAPQLFLRDAREAVDHQRAELGRVIGIEAAGDGSRAAEDVRGQRSRPEGRGPKAEGTTAERVSSYAL